jgi:hypothetical protein
MNFNFSGPPFVIEELQSRNCCGKIGPHQIISFGFSEMQEFLSTKQNISRKEMFALNLAVIPQKSTLIRMFLTRFDDRDIF